MEHCSKLRGYVLDTLNNRERAEFETHLENCDICLTEVQFWQRMHSDLQDWVGSLNVPRVSRNQARRLARQADDKNKHGTAQRFTRPVLVTASIAAGVLVGLFFILSLSPVPAEAPFRPTGAVSLPATASALRPEVLFSNGGQVDTIEEGAHFSLAVPGTGKLVVALAQDRIALGEHSRARISALGDDGLTIELSRGRVAVHAKKRRSTESLTIEAFGHRVRVVGTRFEVALLPRTGCAVSVSEGEVEVTSAGGDEHRVRRGEKLEISASSETVSSRLTPTQEKNIALLLQARGDSGPRNRDEGDGDAGVLSTGDGDPPAGARTPSAPKAQRRTDPSLAELRKLILDGRLQDARTALEERLSRAPRDIEALDLLANCHRKTGDWPLAIQSFEKIIESKKAGPANRARFMAATLMQDKLKNHLRAKKMLRGYLSHRPRPLEAEALVRLLRTQLALGERGEARSTAERVVDRYPDTPSALLAEKLVPEAVGSKGD